MEVRPVSDLMIEFRNDEHYDADKKVFGLISVLNFNRIWFFEFFRFLHFQNVVQTQYIIRKFIRKETFYHLY